MREIKTIDVIGITEEVVSRHHGQVDKSGDPYVHHCLRVGLIAYKKGTTEIERRKLILIGMLHDILEDTDMTPEELAKLCPDKEILEAVGLLTKRKERTYFEYIDLISNNRLAALVKLSDIEDHLRADTKYALPESLRTRYEIAQNQLLESME